MGFHLLAYRYAYSEDADEEFDRSNTLTLIKPVPMPSRDLSSAAELRPLQSGSGLTNVDIEEDKRE